MALSGGLECHAVERAGSNRRQGGPDDGPYRGLRGRGPPTAAGASDYSQGEREKSEIIAQSPAAARALPFTVQNVQVLRDSIGNRECKIHVPEGKILLVATIEFTDDPYKWTSEEYCKLDICDATKEWTRMGKYGKLIGFGDFQLRLKDGTRVPCAAWPTSRSRGFPVQWSGRNVRYSINAPDGKVMDTTQSREAERLAKSGKYPNEEGWLAYMARSTDVIGVIAPADEPTALIWGGKYESDINYDFPTPVQDTSGRPPQGGWAAIRIRAIARLGGKPPPRQTTTPSTATHNRVRRRHCANRPPRPRPKNIPSRRRSARKRTSGPAWPAAAGRGGDGELCRRVRGSGLGRGCGD